MHPTIRNLILLGLSSLLSVCVLQAEYSISYQNQTVANGICYVDVIVSITGDGAPFDIYLDQNGQEVLIHEAVEEGNHLIEGVEKDINTAVLIYDRVATGEYDCVWSETLDFDCDCGEEVSFEYEANFSCHEPGTITLMGEPDWSHARFFWEAGASTP